MTQATPCQRARFPLARILNRVRGLARFSNYRLSSEPVLEDVMTDPIVRRLIAADNLNEGDVRRALARARDHLRVR